MNLDYNEEQIMLREQIQKFCESEYDFYKREEVIKSDKHFDAEVWKLFADQGWLSMPFSEESGGLGFGPIELSNLLGKSPDPPQTSLAASLFSLVINSNKRLNIQTIHAFCQSLLRQFPIEAGVSPHFS